MCESACACVCVFVCKHKRRYIYKIWYALKIILSKTIRMKYSYEWSTFNMCYVLYIRTIICIQ